MATGCPESENGLNYNTTALAARVEWFVCLSVSITSLTFSLCTFETEKYVGKFGLAEAGRYVSLHTTVSTDVLTASLGQSLVDLEVFPHQSLSHHQLIATLHDGTKKQGFHQCTPKMGKMSLCLEI